MLIDVPTGEYPTINLNRLNDKPVPNIFSTFSSALVWSFVLCVAAGAGYVVYAFFASSAHELRMPSPLHGVVLTALGVWSLAEINAVVAALRGRKASKDGRPGSDGAFLRAQLAEHRQKLSDLADGQHKRFDELHRLLAGTFDELHRMLAGNAGRLGTIERDLESVGTTTRLTSDRADALRERFRTLEKAFVAVVARLDEQASVHVPNTRRRRRSRGGQRKNGAPAETESGAHTAEVPADDASDAAVDREFRAYLAGVYDREWRPEDGSEGPAPVA